MVEHLQCLDIFIFFDPCLGKRSRMQLCESALKKKKKERKKKTLLAIMQILTGANSSMVDSDWLVDS